MLCGISPPFEGLSPTSGQVTHVLLTRLPLYSRTEARFLVRLACVKHAASVRSEPGSNSPVKVWNPTFDLRKLTAGSQANQRYQTSFGLSGVNRTGRKLLKSNSFRKAGTLYLVFKEVAAAAAGTESSVENSPP